MLLDLIKWYAWLCQSICVFRARLSRVSACRQRSAASRWISTRRVDARSAIDPDANCAEPEAPVMGRTPPRAVILSGEFSRIFDSSLAFYGRAERRFFWYRRPRASSVLCSATLDHPLGRVISVYDFAKRPASRKWESTISKGCVRCCGSASISDALGPTRTLSTRLDMLLGCGMETKLSPKLPA